MRAIPVRLKNETIERLDRLVDEMKKRWKWSDASRGMLIRGLVETGIISLEHKFGIMPSSVFERDERQAAAERIVVARQIIAEAQELLRPEKKRGAKKVRTRVQKK